MGPHSVDYTGLCDNCRPNPETPADRELFTAADLARAYQAGFDEARELAAKQASIHVVDVYTLGFRTHSTTGLPDLVERIRALQPVAKGSKQ